MDLSEDVVSRETFPHSHAGGRRLGAFHMKRYLHSGRINLHIKTAHVIPAAGPGRRSRAGARCACILGDSIDVERQRIPTIPEIR